MSDKEEIDSLAHGLAGGLSGLISMTLTYPLVTLSTKAQTKKKRRSGGSLNSTSPSTPSVEAIKNLYNGLESALIGITATNFIYYYFYEWTGSKLRSSSKKPQTETQGLKKGLTVIESIVAGAVAGIVSRTLTNPIWIANTRLTVLKKSMKKSASGSNNTNNSSPNTFQVMYSIAKNEGWKNLFNGLIPALFLVLNPVIQYTIFEQLKTLIVTRRKHKLTPFDALILGALGKLIATIVTYPYITVRSRMHLQNFKSLNSHSRSSSTTAGSSSTTTGSETELNDSVQSLPDEIESSSQLPELKQQEKPKGMFSLMLEIVKNEGFITFYNGLSLKLLQSILSAAFLFYFKEELLLKTDSLIKTSKSVGGRSVSIVTLPIRRYKGADK